MLAARERRRSRRYDVQVSVLITPAGAAAEQPCMIHDLSHFGALISVENGGELDDFTLTVSRRCRVVRRNAEGTRVGVEFLVPWEVNS